MHWWHQESRITTVQVVLLHKVSHKSMDCQHNCKYNSTVHILYKSLGPTFHGNSELQTLVCEYTQHKTVYTSFHSLIPRHSERGYSCHSEWIRSSQFHTSWSTWSSSRSSILEAGWNGNGIMGTESWEWNGIMGENGMGHLILI